MVQALISCHILVTKLAICQKIAEKEQVRLKANREQAQMCALNKFREVLDHQVPHMRFRVHTGTGTDDSVCCQIKNIFLSSGGLVQEACISLQKQVHKLEAGDVHQAVAETQQTLVLLRSAQGALEEGSTECYEQQALR